MFGLKKTSKITFNYKPCYWDPKKDEQQKRQRRIRAEINHEVKKEETDSEDNNYEDNIRGCFKKELLKHHTTITQASGRRTVRIFAILILLIMAAFYLFVKNSEGIYRLFGV